MAMTFDDKFNLCVQNFNDILKPDYIESEIDYYVDFVELVVLFSNEDGVTFGDIQDRFFGEKDYDNAKERDEDEKFLNQIFQRIKERLHLYNNEYPFLW
jgi:hypothetical protein